MNLITTTSFFLIVFGGRLIDAATIGEFTNNTSADEDRDTPLTAEQENTVVEFGNENSAILTDDYLRSKNHIVGILRVKKWNKDDAGKQLRRVLQWRATNKIDALGASEADKETLQWIPYTVEGYTRDGCPVILVPFGDWHVDEFMLSKEFARDAIHAFRKHTTQMFEKGRRASKNLIPFYPKCDQVAVIADARNFTMAQVAESNALNGLIHTSTTLETYFQNLYKPLVFINCSEDFHNLVKTLQPYLAHTGKAMSFYKEDESEQARKHVLSLIDPEELPPRYFGTKVE